MGLKIDASFKKLEKNRTLLHGNVNRAHLTLSKEGSFKRKNFQRGVNSSNGTIWTFLIAVTPIWNISYSYFVIQATTVVDVQETSLHIKFIWSNSAANSLVDITTSNSFGLLPRKCNSCFGHIGFVVHSFILKIVTRRILFQCYCRVVELVFIDFFYLTSFLPLQTLYYYVFFFIFILASHCSWIFLNVTSW